MLGTSQVMLSAGQVDEARLLLDKVRLLRSTLKRQFKRDKGLTTEDWAAQFTGVEVNPTELTPLLKKINDCTEEIRVWLTSVTQDVGREELLRSEDGINLLLDRDIPAVWDFNQDIVVLHGENSERFVGPLAKRRQSQIVIVSDSSVRPDEQRSEMSHVISNTAPSSSSTNILRVSDSLDLTKDQLASLTKTVNPELVSINTGLGAGSLDGLQALARNIRKEYVYANSTRYWPATFSRQLIDNLPSIYRCRKVSDLEFMVANKNILIVSPGPSLLESLPQLVLLQKHFLIVSLIRSLPVLLDAGITPDFAILIDASDHTEAGVNLIPDNKLLAEIPLLVTDYAHSSTFQTNFSEFILMPSAHFLGSRIYRAIYGESPLYLDGGGVATFAVSLFAALKANSITLVGQDLSVSDKTYASVGQPSTYKDEIGDLKCLGINGEQLTTQSDFIAFIKEFSFLSLRYSQEVRLINATAYGAFLEGWEHIPLNIEHPAVISEKETEGKVSLSEFLDQSSLAGAKKACIDALAGEIDLANEIEALASSIVSELTRLIKIGGIDVTELEALEQRLNAIMQSDGALLVFYTSAAKLDAKADLASVSSLQENYIVSLDYYKSIETGARRLVPLMAEAIATIESVY